MYEDDHLEAAYEERFEVSDELEPELYDDDDDEDLED